MTACQPPRAAGAQSRRALPAACLAIMLASCAARRELVLTSDPPGAIVRLDERLIGETPLTHEFTHYGERRITLYLDGYWTHSEVLPLKPPWYARFPLDFFSEVLLPIGWKNEHQHHVVLTEGRDRIAPPDLRGVLERADSLRRAGPEGPRPIPKPREDPPPEPSEPGEAPPEPELESEPSEGPEESGEPRRTGGHARGGDAR